MNCKVNFIKRHLFFHHLKKSDLYQKINSNNIKIIRLMIMFKFNNFNNKILTNLVYNNHKMNKLMFNYKIKNNIKIINICKTNNNFRKIYLQKLTRK